MKSIKEKQIKSRMGIMVKKLKKCLCCGKYIKRQPGASDLDYSCKKFCSSKCFTKYRCKPYHVEITQEMVEKGYEYLHDNHSDLFGSGSEGREFVKELLKASMKK